MFISSIVTSIRQRLGFRRIEAPKSNEDKTNDTDKTACSKVSEKPKRTNNEFFTSTEYKGLNV